MKKMRKEVVIGLSVLGVLLFVFGAVLYRRLSPRANADDGPKLADKAILPILEEPRPRVLDAEQARLDEPLPAIEQHAWAPRGGHESRPVEVEQTFDSPESYPPRDAAEMAADASAAHLLTSGEESTVGGDSLPADALVDGDPYAQRQEAATTLADEPVAAEFAGELVADEPAPIERAEESAAMRELVRGQLPMDQPGETIATSASLPDEFESPRAGLRSRFPQSAEQQSDLEAYDRQPAELERGDQAMEHAHPRAQVPVENGKYTVQPNDSYWTISEKVYGDGGYFKAIYQFNRLRFPHADKLQVGDMLDVPHTALLVERYPELCPKQRKTPNARNTLVPASTRQRAGQRVYVVTEGDTLFDIARYELGKATRWNEIYELNREVLGEDFDYLRPGTQLVLPHDHRESDSVTRGRDSGELR